MHPEGWSLPARLAAAVASGVLTWASFPPLDQGWLALFALVPLFLALRGASRPAGALLGAVFGAVFIAALVTWISLFGYLALVLLTLVHGVFYGLFGVIAAGTGRVAGVAARLVAWPLAWAGLEMLRGAWPLGGFTWGDLGYTQHAGGTLLPIARLGGVFALGAVIVLVNALVAEVAAARSGRTVFAGAAVAAVLLPGLAPLALAGPAVGELDVVAVQGNVPREAFRGFGRGRVGPEDEEIVGNHLAVTERLRGQQPDLIVWPENAFDRDPRQVPAQFERVVELLDDIGAPMILPTILDEGDAFTNSALVVEPDGSVPARYDKVHLVPFGEYVPWSFARRIVPALDAEIPVNGRPGSSVEPLVIDGRSIGTLICFESTYSLLARELVRGGAQILVVVTNNASFQDSPASRQHVAMTQLRAVEHGRAVVHAAISGISAIIAPDGRVLDRSDLFEQDLLGASLPLTDGTTPYARYGAHIEMAIGIGAALAAAAALAARRRDERADDGGDAAE